MNGRGSSRHAAICVVVVAVMALAACAALDPGAAPRTADTARPSPTGSQADSTPSERARTPATTAPADPQAFANAFAEVQARLSGPAAVALVSPRGTTLVAGEATSGVAWSTAKVPLAIAALRAGSTPATTNAVRAAIEDSDNAAAERLWAGLGGGARAAAATEAVLAAGGDTATRVPTTQLRPPYTVFGQTSWTVARAAGFAARLPCIDGAGPVLEHMRHVSGNQQWGFWSVRGAAVKGGWGPGSRGGYLVRQLAVVPAAGGEVGVAALVNASSFEAGQRDLDAVAAWAAPYVSALGGRCR